MRDVSKERDQVKKSHRLLHLAEVSRELDKLQSVMTVGWISVQVRNPTNVVETTPPPLNIPNSDCDLLVDLLRDYIRNEEIKLGVKRCKDV